MPLATRPCFHPGYVSTRLRIIDGGPQPSGAEEVESITQRNLEFQERRT
jgi:hypothetical protein